MPEEPHVRASRNYRRRRDELAQLLVKIDAYETRILDSLIRLRRCKEALPEYQDRFAAAQKWMAKYQDLKKRAKLERFLTLRRQLESIGADPGPVPQSIINLQRDLEKAADEFRDPDEEQEDDSAEDARHASAVTAL